MKFAEIAEVLDGVPYIGRNNARRLYEFVIAQKPHECLELGFAHGASSLYIAAALDELGRGQLTSVDLHTSASLNPSIEQLLARTGLQRYVSVVRETNSYTWFLKKQIEKSADPRYDFCFIDGAKNWTIDGCAFFLADRLLKQGGWMLFDDYTWTYAEQEKRTGKQVSDGIAHRELGSDEREQPHVKLIFDLLVMTHPDYGEFRIEDDVWAWAHKVRAERRTVDLETNTSLSAMLVRAARKARDRIKARATGTVNGA